MYRKIRLWWMNWRHKHPQVSAEEKLYTYDEVVAYMEKAKLIGYNDGRKDGLAIARQQATKSLKEILWHQNQKKKNQ